MAAKDTEEDNLNLTANECQARIDQFVEVTKTDEAEAQSLLQEHDWNVINALNAFLGQQTSMEASTSGLVASTKPPSTLSMVTWNIDGIDKKNLDRRTAHIIQVLKKIKPDVILLQEVTDQIVEDLERHMIDYHIIEQAAGMDYFTCVLLRQTTIYLDKAVNTGFENSKMGRGLQRIDCHVGKVKISFMNVHLESTKDFAKERVEQLEKCLSEIKLLNDDTTAILAGDMNIRDKEVASLSNGTGLPPNIKDVWEFLGRRKEAQYSWDTMRNTNLQLPGKFKPRMRFDRVYIRESQPSRLVPTSFNLIGIEKVPGTQSFPSDHWGILTLFEMDG